MRRRVLFLGRWLASTLFEERLFLRLERSSENEELLFRLREVLSVTLRDDELFVERRLFLLGFLASLSALIVSPHRCQ